MYHMEHIWGLSPTHGQGYSVARSETIHWKTSNGTQSNMQPGAHVSAQATCQNMVREAVWVLLRNVRQAVQHRARHTVRYDVRHAGQHIARDTVRHALRNAVKNAVMETVKYAIRYIHPSPKVMADFFQTQKSTWCPYSICTIFGGCIKCMQVFIFCAKYIDFLL